MRSSLLLLAVVLAALVALAAAMPVPPVFEHKADRDFKGTNCEVCQAVVKQALRKLPQGTPDLSTQKARRAREQKVSDVLEGICAVDSFSRYEFSPPTMVGACNAFIADSGEELEGLLFKGVAGDVALRTKLCVDSGLCKALWSPEQEELKRDRSPEEAKREAEEAQAQAKQAEKKKKAEEKAKKAEAAAKKKAEAAAKKAAKVATEAPAEEKEL